MYVQTTALWLVYYGRLMVDSESITLYSYKLKYSHSNSIKNRRGTGWTYSMEKHYANGNLMLGVLFLSRHKLWIIGLVWIIANNKQLWNCKIGQQIKNLPANRFALLYIVYMVSPKYIRCYAETNYSIPLFQGVSVYLIFTRSDMNHNKFFISWWGGINRSDANLHVSGPWLQLM